jgi:hypothetical protein
MVLLVCNSDDSFSFVKFLQDSGPVIISGIALIISYCLTRITLKNQEKQTKMTFDAQKDTEARQEIYKKLNAFYGPLLQLRQESNQLYQKFSEKYRSKNQEFATLTYLLEGNEFVGNDKILLDEIIKLGIKCEDLIHKRAGLIDDPDLLNVYIPRATNHFLVLRLAEKGILKGEVDKFKDLTFPRELDKKLEERKTQLEEDLKKLNKRVTNL